MAAVVGAGIAPGSVVALWGSPEEVAAALRTLGAIVVHEGVQRLVELSSSVDSAGNAGRATEGGGACRLPQEGAPAEGHVLSANACQCPRDIAPARLGNGCRPWFLAPASSSPGTECAEGGSHLHDSAIKPSSDGRLHIQSDGRFSQEVKVEAEQRRTGAEEAGKQKEYVEGTAVQEEQEDAQEEPCTAVQVLSMSGTVIASESMATTSTGAHVKALVGAGLEGEEKFVRSLIAEDGRVMEDTTTLAEMAATEVVRLSAVLGRKWWVGQWTPCWTALPGHPDPHGERFRAVLNDVRVSNYMDICARLVIRASGEAFLSTPGGPEHCFEGEPPGPDSEVFTVLSCGEEVEAARRRGEASYLAGLRLVRQPGGNIRAYHLGTGFSWLREESAYIEYQVAELSAGR